MPKIIVRSLSLYERLLWLTLLVTAVLFRSPLLTGHNSQFQPDAASAALTPAAPRASHAAAGTSGIAWRTDLQAALVEARQTGRPVLLDFNASWCPPCIAMKHEVWTDPDVVRGLGSYVPVSIDVDHDPAGTSNQFQVDGIPSILVLDANGRVIRRTGYLAASDMLRFLGGA